MCVYLALVVETMRAVQIPTFAVYNIGDIWRAIDKAQIVERLGYASQQQTATGSSQTLKTRSTIPGTPTQFAMGSRSTQRDANPNDMPASTCKLYYHTAGLGLADAGRLVD